MTSKKYILDPIDTLCRLITLNFRPKETKISIMYNSIVIQPPSSLQWMQRKINGDDRDNISHLFQIIVKMIEWYIIPLHTLKFKNKRPKINVVCDEIVP